MMNEAIKILVVDDHPSYLKGVSSLLQSIFSNATVITALNGAEALTCLKQHFDVDWILLDINLPDCSGLELLEQFKAKKLVANIIIITADSNSDIMDQALKHHVSGFLTKDFDSHVLAECFKTIENDRVFLLPEHAHQLKNYRESVLLEKQVVQQSISERQQQTLIMIAKGYSNHEIADCLGIADSTVKKHVSSLIAIFEADNRTHCVAEARRLKLID